MSKDELSSLQDSLHEKRKELDVLEKDRAFLKKKVERLEDQLFQKEKKFLREEAEKDFDSEERMRRLVQENETLKEEIISRFLAYLVLEKANCRLFNDIEYCKGGSCSAGNSDKLRAENERLRELFKKAEMNWLKERQSLLNEIEMARDERTENTGYRSMRPEREHNDGKDNKVKFYYA